MGKPGPVSSADLLLGAGTIIPVLHTWVVKGVLGLAGVGMVLVSVGALAPGHIHETVKCLLIFAQYIRCFFVL